MRKVSQPGSAPSRRPGGVVPRFIPSKLALLAAAALAAAGLAAVPLSAAAAPLSAVGVM